MELSRIAADWVYRNNPWCWDTPTANSVDPGQMPKFVCVEVLQPSQLNRVMSGQFT